MSSRSPAKRNLDQLIKGNHIKNVVTRRDVKIFATVVGSPCEMAIMYCKTDRGENIEPYTFPARRAVQDDSNSDNTLRRLGIIFINTRVINPEKNEPFLTNRGYSYNAFVIYSDKDLLENSGRALEDILQRFATVRTIILLLKNYITFSNYDSNSTVHEHQP